MTNFQTTKSRMGMLILFLVLFVPMTVKGQRPDWVDLHSSKYPDNRYFLGVGRGDDDRSAEKNAYATIARIFQVSVTQSQKEVSRYLNSQSGGDTRTEWDVKATEITELSTKKTLEGVQIVETWVDSDQLVFKLAVLDRRKQALILEERLKELDNEVNNYSKTIRESSDKLQVARSYFASIRMIMRRDANNNDYRIINPSGRGMKFKNTLGTISSGLQEFLAREFNMAIQIVGPNSGKVRIALVENLTKSGFSILGQSSSNTPHILVKGKLSFKKLDTSSSNKFIRWRADFQLINLDDDKEFGSLVRRGREAHVSYEAAEQRALRILIQQVNEKLAKEIFTFVFGS
jgi:hypothetical protein